MMMKMFGPLAAVAIMGFSGAAIAAGSTSTTQVGDMRTDPTGKKLSEEYITQADCINAGTDGKISIGSTTMTEEDRTAAVARFCDSLGTDGKITK